jgi:hypothetical protein
VTTLSDVQTAHQKIVRRAEVNAVAIAVAATIDGGTNTLANYKAQLIANKAPQCTSPALIVSNYIEGVVPASAIVDSRAWYCQQQHDAYLSAGQNAALGPYEALGAAFGAEASFAVKVAGRTLSQVIGDVYVHAFLTLPSSAAETNLVNQYNYFYALYTGAGMSASVADLRAKGAVVGQILGYAGTTTGNTLQNKAIAWLYAAAAGTETYGTPL